MTLWFIAAAGLLALSARWLQSIDPNALPGVPAALVALAGLMAAGILLAQRPLQSLRRLAWPGWAWQALGLFATIVASYMAAQTSFASDDQLVTQQQAVPLWLLSIAGALLIARPRAGRRASEPATPRWEALALAGLVALALLLRVYDLGRVPYALLGDETKYALEGRAVIEGRLFKPFTTSTDGQWVMYLSVNAAFMRLFGQTVEAIRLHSALVGVLSVAATFAVVRQLWGRRAALIAAALLTTYHFHVHYSRLAINAVYDSLLVMLLFGWLWRGWLTGRRVPWLMAALAAGLAQYFYVGSRLILIEAVVLGLFWLVTRPRQVRARLLDLGLSIGLFATVVMPVVYFAQKRPDDYLTRLNQSGVIQSGWLQAEMDQRGVGAGVVLGEQLEGVLRLFVQGPDGLFYLGQSLLAPVMSVLVGLSLIVLLSRIREGPSFWLLTTLGLIVLFGGVLTIGPMSGSQRLLGASPLLMAGIAVLIDQLLAWAGQAWRRPRAWQAIGVAAVAGLMLGDAHVYFGQYVPARVANSLDVEWSMQLGAYLREVEQRPAPGEWQVVCDGAPWLYCDHSNVRFLAPRLSQVAQTLSAPFGENLAPKAGFGLIVIVAPQRSDDVLVLQERFPKAVRRDHYGAHGDLLFTSLEAPSDPP